MNSSECVLFVESFVKCGCVCACNLLCKINLLRKSNKTEKDTRYYFFVQNIQSLADLFEFNHGHVVFRHKVH